MRETEKITSRDNRRLVDARKVRDGRSAGFMFIEGRRLVGEAVRSGLRFEDCFVAAGFSDVELAGEVRDRAAAFAELPGKIFDSVADTKNSQGIIVIARRPAASIAVIEDRIEAAQVPVVVFLHEINNPSNLGAVLRSAEAAGAAGVVVSANSADAFSAKATRSAMGSNFRLPICENVSLTDAVLWAGKRGLAPTAAVAETGKSYSDIDWRVPRLLVLGSEAHGLDDAHLAMIADKVTIPIEITVESLNLAVSAGILLFEARRQGM